MGNSANSSYFSQECMSHYTGHVCGKQLCRRGNDYNLTAFSDLPTSTAVQV